MHCNSPVGLQLQIIAIGDKCRTVSRPVVGQFITQFVAEGETVSVTTAVAASDEIACIRVASLVQGLYIAMIQCAGIKVAETKTVYIGQ